MLGGMRAPIRRVLMARKISDVSAGRGLLAALGVHGPLT
jgi:hypothetical protein